MLLCDDNPVRGAHRLIEIGNLIYLRHLIDRKIDSSRKLEIILDQFSGDATFFELPSNILLYFFLIFLIETLGIVMT